MDSLAQDCSNSIANAMELLQPCIKPSIYCNKYSAILDRHIARVYINGAVISTYVVIRMIWHAWMSESWFIIKNKTKQNKKYTSEVFKITLKEAERAHVCKML